MQRFRCVSRSCVYDGKYRMESAANAALDISKNIAKADRAKPRPLPSIFSSQGVWHYLSLNME